MRSIWWVTALVIFALIFLLFPVREVTHVDKKLVVGNGTYYELDRYADLPEGSHIDDVGNIGTPDGWTIWANGDYTTPEGERITGSSFIRCTPVTKTGEVVKVQVMRTTGRRGMFESLWIHTFSTSFSPIVITGSAITGCAITGSARKTSQPFTVNTKQWVIDWAYVPDPNHPEGNFFGFVVTTQGETTSDVESMLFPEETSGSIHSDAGPGEYYVTVEATNIRSWGILIKPA